MAENWSFIVIIALYSMIIIIVYICAYSTFVVKCTVVCIVHFIYPIFRGGFDMYVWKITVFKNSVVFFLFFFLPVSLAPPHASCFSVIMVNMGLIIITTNSSVEEEN